MSTDNDETPGASFGEWIQRQEAKDLEYSQRDYVRKALTAGHKRLVVERYGEVATLIDRYLVPMLLDERTLRCVRSVGQEAKPREFHGYALTRAVQADGPLDAGDATTIEQAFVSLESVAVARGIVDENLKNRVDVVGYSVKLGEQIQRADMDFGDPVEAITRRLGALKHFYTGGTAGGKSSGAARQFEDYYRKSLSEGTDYKCLDVFGISTENVNAFDVPQRQAPLREVRDDHGLPADWTEIDGYDPTAEILVPLSPDLGDYRLPYDVDADEFVPKPFSIPASELTEGLLSAIIAARVTASDEKTIRQAYRAVDNRYRDWSLEDLRREIWSRDDLSEKNKESAGKVLDTLQSEGIIRTAGDDHALTRERWREIFHSTETITVFNQSVLETDLSRYLVIAHLVDCLWEYRIRAHDQPSAVVWMRELHTVAPHVQIRRRQPEAIENIMDQIVAKLGKMMRLPRDISTHIIADTQDPTDPEKGIRERFNRYVVFGGSESDIKDIFNWASQDGVYSFQRTMDGKPGRAGIIKGCEPAIKSSSKWGIAPVHLTPPSWHHHDKDEGPSGWAKRARISQEVDVMNDEELRTPSEWPLHPDDASQADGPSPADGSDGAEKVRSDGGRAEIQESTDESEREEQTESQFQKELAKTKARQLRSHTTKSLREIADEIPNNPKERNPYTAETVRDWTEDIDKGSGEKTLISE